MAETLPAPAKAASETAVTNAIKDTDAALSKLSLKEEAAANESLEEGEIVETEDGEAEDQDSAEGGLPKQITVFADHQKFNVVHPLLNAWCVSITCRGLGSSLDDNRTLWFDNASKQDKAKSWDEQLTEVLSFESVETFWGSVASNRLQS